MCRPIGSSPRNSVRAADSLITATAEQLPDDAPAIGAERGAKRDLGAPPRPVRQQQRRDARAREHRARTIHSEAVRTPMLSGIAPPAIAGSIATSRSDSEYGRALRIAA